MLRWIRRIALVLLVVVLVALVAGGGLAFLTVRASFPQVSGEVTVPGLSASVEVRRDEWGIPHITADTAEDLFRAQGYVHAQDRFWEMDFRRHVTAGRLAELFGEDQVENDSFIRTLGWRRVAEQELEILSAETISYLEAYAAGVNAYLDTHAGSSLSLEYAVLALQNGGYEPEPWTPADSVAWLKAMAWNLSGNMDQEIQRVQYAARLSDAQLADVDPPYPYDRHPVILPGIELAGPTSTTRQTGAPNRGAVAALASRLTPIASMDRRVADLLGVPSGAGIGSNSFVVDGSRTASGLPLLANDPHLAPSMPGIWHQISLHCRAVTDACPFDVSGFSLSGFPGIVLGHNDRVAWGFTNLGPDVQDLYLEDVQGDRYRSPSGMRDLEIRTETIAVAGGDPVTIRVRSTSHGPLISDPIEYYSFIGMLAPIQGEPMEGDAAPDVALAWTALTPGRTADAVFLINRSQDFDDFREAAASFEVPSQNMLYADVDGHIGYQAPGVVPIRRGYDGKWPVAGWDSSFGWDGFADFDDMPWVFDPDAGYIVTANNAVTDPDYPVFLTDDWSLGDRAARIVELLEAAGPLDVAGMQAVAFDQHGPLADVLAPALLALPKDSGTDARTSTALDLLDGWDGQQTADSAAAAFLNTVWLRLLPRTFGDEIYYTDYFPDGGDRWVELMRTLVEEPDNPWWDDVSTADVVEDRDMILTAAVDEAFMDLGEELGTDPGDWQWGTLHTLELRNETFGMSGIAPIEWLFNRGPYELGGGQDVVDATGWNAREGLDVSWVPSMRMVVDLSDLDASRYVNLTGTSGHAFHEHYDDQTPLWATGESTAWPFTAGAVEDATVDLLVLTPE